VTEIADRITVLRRGKKIETLPAEGATEAGLARLMVGREVLLRVDKTPGTPAEPLLEVENLHVVDDRGIAKVRGVGFQVRAGEIVGIAGVDGNGQTELIDAITGLRHPAEGRIVVAGSDVTGASARDSLDAGLGHIPEDRQRRGLVLDFSLAENIALHDYDHAPSSRFGWLYPKRLVAKAAKLIREFDVRGGGPQTPAGSLSSSCTAGSSASATRAAPSCSSRSSWRRSSLSRTGSSSCTRARSWASSRRTSPSTSSASP
jgi:simple sugar transport system ATP-binding protein